MGISILNDKCIGCKLCVPACPFGAITVAEKKAVIGDACTLCGACEPACKFGAIKFAYETGPAADLSAYQGVWVFAEQRGGKLADVALELLGEGRQLATVLQQPLAAFLLGSGIGHLAKELIAFGAERVYVADHADLRCFIEDSYTAVLTEMARAQKPNIILLGATAIGRSLAPRVAARLGTGLTADCTGLAADPGTKDLWQTRPAFGGNVMATILTQNHRPQMATVRPRVFCPLPKDENRTGETVNWNLTKTVFDHRVKLLESMTAQGEKVNLAEAEIIVSAGRGLGDQKNLCLVKDLADALGGVVGASRAVVDAGWIAYQHQVGQTGKTVRPKLYVACGIHGAIQHLAGMQSAEVIVAINKNPEAPIFKVAHYGIVGDAMEVIPEMLKELKKAK